MVDTVGSGVANAGVTSRQPSAASDLTADRVWSPRTQDFIYGAVLFVLSAPVLIVSTSISSSSLDSSWQIGLNMGAHSHMQWGTQITFTYGPLGFLNFPMTVFYSLWAISLLTIVVVHLAVVVAVIYFIRATNLDWKWKLWAGLAFVFLSVIFLAEISLSILLAIVSVLALLDEDSWALPVLTGVVAGLDSMIKGTATAFCVSVLVVFAVAALTLRRRRLWIGIATFVASFILFWVVAHQSIENIPRYFSTMLDVENGYVFAQTTGSKLGTLAIVPMFIGTAIIAGFAAYQLKTTRNRNIFPYVVIWLLSMVYYKEAVTRFDHGHIATGLVVFPFVLLLLGGVTTYFGLDRLQLWSNLAMGGLVVCMVIGIPVLLHTSVGNVLSTPLRNLKGYGTAAHMLISPGTADSRINQGKQAIRETYGVPPWMVSEVGSYSVAAMPWDIALPYAYDMNWDPLPTLQSYAAYSPQLDSIDAAQLASPGAPRRVFWRFEEDDNRNPLLDEPKTTQVLLMDYAPVDPQQSAKTDWVLLARDARSARLITLKTVSLHLGDWAAVPAHPPSALVYVSVPIVPTMRENVTALLASAGVVDLEVQYHNGSFGESRVTASNMADGVLISNLPRSKIQFVSLFTNAAEARVVRYRFVEKSSGTFTISGPAVYSSSHHIP